MGIRTNVLLNNFSSGEISPELLGRVDLAKYQNACETMVNWLPLIEGGMQRRPGTRFVAEAKVHTQPCRIVPFIFSIVQSYLLEFGQTYLRFYKDGGQIIDGAGVPIELGTPYTAAQLPQLKFRQDADTLYIAHPNHSTKKLTRSSHTVWALQDVPFSDGPFLDTNRDDAWLITAAGGELIVNGTFTTDLTGWADVSEANGDFRWDTGVAELENVGGDDGAGETSIATVPGLVYTVTFTVGTGSLNAQVGTASGLQDVLASATYTTGAKSFVFTAKSPTSYLRWTNVTSGTVHTLDTVSCIKPLHTGAAVTMTSTHDTWLPGHVGALWRLGDKNGSPSNNPWVTGASVAPGSRAISSGNIYESVSTGTTGTRPPVHLRGTASDGGVEWAFINDGTGYVQITTYVSAREVTAVVRQHLPANASTGTSYWAEGAFSDVQGHPRALAFIEQRFALAGATNTPYRVDLSETGNYEGFRAGTQADRALSFVVNSGEVNQILWMEKGKAWFIGTNGVVYVAQTSDKTPVAPDNLPNVDEFFSFGAAEIQPLKIGGNLLYVQRGGKRVREINFEAGATNDIRSDRTVLARHITSNTRVITGWAYEQDPNSTVWAVRSDGALLALTYFPEQDVFAWSRHTTQGRFESVASIPTATSDQTWVVVQRTINGVTKRYIEYFDETLNTDCALTYQGPPAVSTIAAASVAHLLGKEVQIIASGGKLTPQTMTANDLTFDREHAFVEIGLQYDSDALTVRPEIRTGQGSLQGVKARNPKATVRVVDTPTIRLNNQNYPTRGTRDYMDTGPPFVTGDLELFTLGHTTTKQIRIQQVEPFPAKVIGIFATFDAGDL